MTAFSKLKTMDDKQIQDWLTKVGRANVIALGIGLLAADDGTKNCVYRNMSEKARAVLAQDIGKNKKRNFSERDILSNAENLERMI